MQSYSFLLMSMVNNMYLYRSEETFSKRIHIVLKAMVTVTAATNPFTVATNPSTTLQSFSSWQRGVKTTYAHDNAVLISRVDMDGGTIGLAWVDTTCDSFYSANINQDTGFSTAATIAHEIGHNFGASYVPPSKQRIFFVRF